MLPWNQWMSGIVKKALSFTCHKMECCCHTTRIMEVKLSLRGGKLFSKWRKGLIGAIMTSNISWNKALFLPVSESRCPFKKLRSDGSNWAETLWSLEIPEPMVFCFCCLVWSFLSLISSTSHTCFHYQMDEKKSNYRASSPIISGFIGEFSIRRACVPAAKRMWPIGLSQCTLLHWPLTFESRSERDGAVCTGVELCYNKKYGIRSRMRKKNKM